MFKRLRAALAAFYEAGKRIDTVRPYIPGRVTDHFVDWTEQTRMEVVRKSQYYEANDAYAQQLAEIFVEFSVGHSGPIITPASSDDAWNERAADWLRNWLPVAGVDNVSFGELMTQAAYRNFFDGEFFIQLLQDNKGRPALRGIAGHRVGSPDLFSMEEGRILVDGVRVGPAGEVRGYYVQTSLDSDKYSYLPADNLIHIFEKSSPNQFRGMPWLTPVLNDLADLNFLVRCEIQAAKVQGLDAIVYETAGGEMPKSAFSIAPKASATPSTSAEPQIRAAHPGRVFSIKQGEKVSNLASNRPSVTTQWFFDFLLGRVCAGTGIRKILIAPASIQGTVARGEYEMARNFFLSRFTTYRDAVQRIYEFAINVARFNDRKIADAPADWQRVMIRPPRVVNVDVGRNSAATIAELDNFLTTYEEQYALRGLDFKQQLAQRIREESTIREMADKAGIDPEKFRQSVTKVEELKPIEEDEEQTITG